MPYKTHKVCLPLEQIDFFNKKLNKTKGLKEKAVSLSGLSRFSYFKIMKGGLAKQSTVKRVIVANNRILGISNGDLTDSLLPGDELEFVLLDNEIKVGLFSGFLFEYSGKISSYQIIQSNDQTTKTLTLPLKIIKSIKVIKWKD